MSSLGVQLRLRPLRLEDEAAALAAHRELAADGFDLLEGWKPTDTWPEYLDRVAAMASGSGLPDGWVPATLLVAEASGELVGMSGIRHRLSPSLAEVGGHIGYAVRPQFRRRGYATEMLRSTLKIAADLGLTDVLLTCNADNVASARIIERCGGHLAKVLPATSERPAKHHYWMKTTNPR